MMTTTEENEELYRRLIEEAFNDGDLDLVAGDCVLYEAG